MKDSPIDRVGPRERLLESLDDVFKEPFDRAHNLDAVEGKLFGIGFESFTVGSHEFYLGYALTRRVLYTLDTGHYHPTETITDKLSAVFMYLPDILLHVSRGVRWDSDHVVVLNDDLEAIAQELVRGRFLGRTRIGLDYFDASINRVAAWVIGARNMLKALLKALLEPTATLRRQENDANYTERLATLEEFKALPWGAVWDYYCASAGVGVSGAWLADIRQYERDVLAARA
jgi:L-rhamnose isomerase